MARMPTLAAVLLAFTIPASASTPKAPAKCPEGQVKARTGECVAACATSGAFNDPSACECPAGFGKILLGSGGGQCLRLVCKTDAVVDPALCDCPKGFTMKSAKKGKARCVSEKVATTGAKAK